MLTKRCVFSLFLSKFNCVIVSVGWLGLTAGTKKKNNQNKAFIKAEIVDWF